MSAAHVVGDGSPLAQLAQLCSVTATVGTWDSRDRQLLLRRCVVAGAGDRSRHGSGPLPAHNIRCQETGTSAASACHEHGANGALLKVHGWA